MRKVQRLLWHRLTPRELTMLNVLAAGDGVLLLAIGFGALAGDEAVALSLITSYSAVFLVLVGSLAAFADRRRASWWLVFAVMASGPAGALVALRGCRPISRPPGSSGRIPDSRSPSRPVSRDGYDLRGRAGPRADHRGRRRPP